MKYNMDKHNITDLDLVQRKELIYYYKELCQHYKVKLQACMKHSLITGLDIEMASCIDGELIEQMSGKILNNMDINTKSRACNCMPYVDIGVYDTCALNCAYCYANSHTSKTKRNNQQHNPDSEILFGEINYNNIVSHKRNVSNFTDQRQTRLDI